MRIFLLKRSGQNGSAVLVILAMIAIIMIFVTINVVAVRNLGRELKLIEQKQNQRLQKHPANASGGVAHE